MAQIDVNLARVSSPLGRGNSIREQTQAWYKSNKSVSDVDLFGLIYKQIYKSFILCMYPGNDETLWRLRLAKKVSILQPSTEKDFCLAYLDQNNDGWLFDKFPKWHDNPLLACILTRRSTGWCISSNRLKVYFEAFKVGSTLRGRSPVLGESMDSLYSKARFLTTKDKKYIRMFIDQTRLYISHTPDPTAHQFALADVATIEELHFKKKSCEL